MKYKILYDYGAYEGCRFQDEEYDTVDAAVKAALDKNYATPFFIVNVVDWKAYQKCPHDDCWKVKYKDCPVHGTNP